MELVATPNNPVPPRGSASAVRTADGRVLRVATFATEGEARGTVALFPGRAEFIEKYFETIGELLARGYHVAAMDWRGQGGSERDLADPRKGHIDDFALYQRDLDAFIGETLTLSCPRPWHALAHSMGAAILLDRAHSARSPFERLALIAPMIDIEGLRFPKGARALADTLDMFGLGAMYVPGGNGRSLIELPFEGNRLTSDHARFARNAEPLAVAPNLAVGDPTVGWINAAFRLMKQFSAPEYARAIRAPALIFSCGRDRIVSSRAIERFARRLPVGNLVAIPGARHELLMERDELREQFWAAFDAFVPGEAAPAET
ncbi:alpha/beta fold hydrolase [Methylosinus sp. Sm6]|uniref:alpha/beta fold hydrolase n=1 Tax=Methylosinus sp. Sm6 TaxID=2866948 RepID=UPI001C9942DC|nr:alpha/beta hydrolase [Methylosinus sp. Sm6]MBY6241451.1 alpha/beta hydrolase [Methylosinus sp. Sm6]